MRNFFQLLVLTSALLFATSCEKDFEEINRNPFYPTQTDIGPLFNSVIESLQLGWDEQFYIHNETLYAITEQAALTAEAFQNITIGTEGMWRNYYGSLANIRELERRFAAWEGNPEVLDNVQSQLKIILAYKTFRLTDMFGDIPFFDAGKGFESLEFIEPKFDVQEDIYKFLLEELKWASEHIVNEVETPSGEPYLSFGDFDKLFNGNLMRWEKFANSLRLRYALRMAEKDPAFAEPIIRDVLENDLPLIEGGEDVGMFPSLIADWRKESTHWSFREHRKLRMGSTIWHQLSENDNIDGSGIFDPRARIFFETNNADEWVPYPQIPDAGTPSEGGSPYQGQRDFNYSAKGASNLFSPFNYYLIRDEEYVPELILTAAEVNFIKAEIYMRGLGVPADPAKVDEEYTIGVVNSLILWQSIFANTPIWVNAPPELSIPDFFNLVNNHPRISIFDNENKLELIYTQRWLDAFRQPWEAYSLLRRTGATPRENPIPEHYRFSYPPSEVENNPTQWAEQVAKMGEDSPSVKVWWMN